MSWLAASQKSEWVIYQFSEWWQTKWFMAQLPFLLPKFYLCQILLRSPLLSLFLTLYLFLFCVPPSPLFLFFGPVGHADVMYLKAWQLIVVFQVALQSRWTSMIDQTLEEFDIYNPIILTRVSRSMYSWCNWQEHALKFTHTKPQMHSVVSARINAQAESFQLIAYSLFQKECAWWIKHFQINILI